MASVRELAKGWWAYHRALPAVDAWARSCAAERGLAVNPHPIAYLQRLVWLAENDALYGRRACPSFEPPGTPEADAKITCPCAYSAEEVAGRGVCTCALFGAAGATSADFRMAEQRHAHRYLAGPFHWSGKVLDTRGRRLDSRRRLPVPDAMHQVRSVIASRGLPLTAIVETQVQADHLCRLGKLRGFSCVYDARAEGGMFVRMGEA